MPDTIYLKSFITTMKHFWKTHRSFNLKWAWACSQSCVIGGGARSIDKSILINEGIIRLQEMAKEKGSYIDVDKYLKDKYHDRATK